MEAELIGDDEFIGYEYIDGGQVIITTTEEALNAAGLSGLHGAQVLEVLHEEDGEGNIIISTHDFITQDTSLLDADTSQNDQLMVQQNSSELETGTEIEAIEAESEESEPEPPRHKCDSCDAEFESKKVLRLHSAIHKDEAYYACEFCSESKIHWTEYWLHQCTNLGSDPIICPQCHKNVGTKKQLQVHEEVHSLQQRFKSKRMERYFNKRLGLDEPDEVDKGSKPFICGVCGKPFQRLREVEYHEKLHNGERPTGNECDKCGLSYLNRNDLNKHTAMGCTGQLSRKTNPEELQITS